MQESREPNVNLLSVAIGGDEKDSTNHLATGMRKHPQGNKVKVRKLSFASVYLKVIHLFHILKGQSDQRMLEM